MRQPDWYTARFLPRMRPYRRGPLVWDPKAVVVAANSAGRKWAIYKNGVYDLTDYFNTVSPLFHLGLCWTTRENAADACDDARSISYRLSPPTPSSIERSPISGSNNPVKTSPRRSRDSTSTQQSSPSIFNVSRISFTSEKLISD